LLISHHIKHRFTQKIGYKKYGPVPELLILREVSLAIAVFASLQKSCWNMPKKQFRNGLINLGWWLLKE